MEKTVVRIVLHTWGGVNAEIQGVFRTKSGVDQAIAASIAEVAQSELDEGEAALVLEALKSGHLDKAMDLISENDHYYQVENWELEA